MYNHIYIPFYSQVLNSMVAASPCVPSLPRAGVRLRPRSGARSDEPIRIPPAFFGLTLGYWPSNFGPISSCMDLTLILKIPYLSWRSFLAILLGNLGRSSRSSRTTESERILNKKDHSDSLETQNEPNHLRHCNISSFSACYWKNIDSKHTNVASHARLCASMVTFTTQSDTLWFRSVVPGTFLYKKNDLPCIFWIISRINTALYSKKRIFKFFCALKDLLWPKKIPKKQNNLKTSKNFPPRLSSRAGVRLRGLPPSQRQSSDFSIRLSEDLVFLSV